MTLLLAQRGQAAFFLLATVTIVLLGAHVAAAEEPSFEYPEWYLGLRQPGSHG